MPVDMDGLVEMNGGLMEALGRLVDTMVECCGQMYTMEWGWCYGV